MLSEILIDRPKLALPGLGSEFTSLEQKVSAFFNVIVQFLMQVVLSRVTF